MAYPLQAKNRYGPQAVLASEPQPSMMGRILVAAASACALVCLVAAPAGAAPALRIEPAPHGKVHAGIAGVPSRGRLVYLLDGHRVRLTRRHAISLSVPRHRGAMAVWHRFEVRRPGSKL